MGKYDYIKNGNLLYWNDPHNGKSDGEYKVVSAPEFPHLKKGIVTALF